MIYSESIPLLFTDDVISGPSLDPMLGRALGTSPQNWPRGRAGHVTQIRLFDWSKFEMVRSDWSGAKPLPCTTRVLDISPSGVP